MRENEDMWPLKDLTPKTQVIPEMVLNLEPFVNPLKFETQTGQIFGKYKANQGCPFRF